MPRKQNKRRKVAENGIVCKLFLCVYGKKKKQQTKQKQKELLGLYTHKVVIIREGKKNAILSMPEGIKGRMTWKHNQQGTHQMLTT
jgi:hypothetical protein